jgi:hypothetical protein
MLIESGDLIPVRREAVDIPWTKRKTQILQCLHKGPVSFRTYVYDTNVGDIAQLSTYFNPKKWTEHDLNFKFGITTSENLLNVNSTGNSSASSTVESIASSSNFRRLPKDLSEGENSTFKGNSLQPRLMVISDDECPSSVSRQSSENESSSKDKNISKRSDAMVKTELSTAPKFSKGAGSFVDAINSKCRSSSHSDSNHKQAERTESWVKSCFCDVTNQKFEGFATEKGGLALPLQSTLNIKKNDNVASHENKRNIEDIEDIKTAKLENIPITQAGYFADNKSFKGPENLFQDVPNITCTNTNGENSKLLNKEKMYDMSIPMNSENAINSTEYHSLSERFNNLSPVEKYDPMQSSEPSLAENTTMQSTMQDTMEAVLYTYGIRKRSASVADLPIGQHGRKVEPIGPPSKLNVEMRLRQWSEPNFNSTHMESARSAESTKENVSVSPNGWCDDVFSDQNGLKSSNGHKHLNSTTVIEGSMNTNNCKTCADESLQCQHDHWGKKFLEKQFTPLEVDWRSSDKGNKTPLFLSPWPYESTLGPVFPMNISPTNSLEEHDRLNEYKQSWSNEPSQDIQNVNAKLLKSPYVSAETSPVSDGNSTTSSSSKGNLAKHNQKMENIHNKDDNTENKLDQIKVQNMKSGFLDENLSAYLGFGPDLSTLFDGNRGSSFFEFWTPGRFSKQIGQDNDRYSRTVPDKIDAIGKEIDVAMPISNSTVNETKSQDRNSTPKHGLVAKNFASIDTEHLVRGLRKLAGEKMPANRYH